MDKTNDKEEKKVRIARRIQGTIISTKMQETAVVKVVTNKIHSKYGKSFKSTRKFNCHNAEDKFKLNDKVIFEECRPMSKTKRWRIIKKV